MGFEPFAMERWQSTYENEVELNLSDSGVRPLSLRELFGGVDHVEALLDEPLHYIQTNGTPELRSLIAGMYPGADVDNVEVVNGGAEANFLATWTLAGQGDELVMMLPNYMQVFGLARSLGAETKAWNMRADLDAGRWVFDLDELARLVTPRTRLIAICNPNNPTGARLTAEELDGIGRIADRHGACVLSDEIYCGAELAEDAAPTPSMWGRAERVVVTNSLSKAYGLPGLRLGWLVAPRDLAQETWARHDYTTIGPGTLSDVLARIALEPATRRRLLSTNRALLRSNYALIRKWLDERAETLRYVPPEAGAMLYLAYSQPVSSSELAERLRVEKSVLLVPGDHYGMDGWLRIGFGGEPEHVERGLERVDQLLSELAAG